MIKQCSGADPEGVLKIITSFWKNVLLFSQTTSFLKLILHKSVQTHPRSSTSVEMEHFTAKLQLTAARLR